MNPFFRGFQDELLKVALVMDHQDPAAYDLRDGGQSVASKKGPSKRKPAPAPVTTPNRMTNPEFHED